MGRKGYYRRTQYRYTPARRAALRRAQQISAQKRRQQRRRQVGYVAAGLGALFVTHQLNRYARDPRQIGRDYRDLKKLGNTTKTKTKNAVRKAKTTRSKLKMRYGRSGQLRLW